MDSLLNALIVEYALVYSCEPIAAGVEYLGSRRLQLVIAVRVEQQLHLVIGEVFRVQEKHD